ncbi:hypothetical protein DM860_015665 [Cuscuta australis]|uniref:NB-ARC domain-containing protein n=1 Tax=Cuscuta australis TaxID=267555 RepID=A0A328DES8_9ASTE|nr:hypothetical protein DM860_015665 [Cuscuta australis]
MYGNALRFKSSQEEWNAVLSSKLWELNQHMLSSLKRSYDQFSPSLKKCFNYCSMFHKTFQFKKEDLVQLWVSEGLIKPKGITRVEDVDSGIEFFDILLQNSIFELSNDDATRPLYRMHNAFFALANFISHEEVFQMEDDDQQLALCNFGNVRRMSLCWNERNQQKSLEFLPKCRRLRTLVVRVLSLSSSGITMLPTTIKELKHLRHLDVSETGIEMLPDEITLLHGMEFLKLNYCFKLTKLSRDMKNLTNLCHLEFDMDRINAMPAGFGKLTCLQTLSGFRVGENGGECIKELKELNFLHGSLCIAGLENVVSNDQACKAMLENKSFLEGLEFQWKNVINDVQSSEVLCGLKPHSGIKNLTINGYGSVMFPTWFGEPSLYPRIQSIVLNHCMSCKLFPDLGSLPMLKSLYIGQMRDLMEFDCSERGLYPSLQALVFCDMDKLQVVKGLKVGHMANLSTLIFENCPNLVSLPVLHHCLNLMLLNIFNCPKIQQLPIEGLPKSLKSLTIKGCSNLSQQCAGGVDYSIIQSIPEVVIDG